MQSTLHQGEIMGNKSNMQFLSKSGMAVLFMLLGASDVAVAQDAGQIAQNVSNSFNYIGLAFQAFAALAGIVLIILSAFTFIRHNKTEGQGAKLSTAFLYLILGGCLFYIASLIQTTGDTVWGTGGGDRSRVTISR